MDQLERPSRSLHSRGRRDYPGESIQYSSSEGEDLPTNCLDRSGVARGGGGCDSLSHGNQKQRWPQETRMNLDPYLGNEIHFYCTQFVWLCIARWWMSGWMGCWRDGWLEGWVSGWVGGLMGGWTG